MNEEKQDKQKFDSNRQIDVKLSTPDGPKVITVKFPTDVQIESRQRARQILIKDLGRGEQENQTIENEQADERLVSELKTGGEGTDGAEASAILDRITEAEVTDVEREGSSFRVSVRVPGSTTEHVLRVPTTGQRRDYRRRFSSIITMPYGRKRIKIHLSAGGDLYDELMTAAEGYTEGSAIPINHKAQAVAAVIQELAREESAEGEDPNS